MSEKIALGIEKGEPESKSNKSRYLTILIFFVISISSFDILDKQADEYLSDSFSSALKSYAVARITNGAISMLQTVEGSVGLASIQVGEFLDPINDAVERFSDLITVAIASIVFQQILLEIVSSIFFKILLAFSGILLIASLHYKVLLNSVLVIKTFVFLVFIRFSLVLIVLLSFTVDNFFLEKRMKVEQENTAEMAEKLRVESKKETDRTSSLLLQNERLKKNGIYLENKISVSTSIVNTNMIEVDKIVKLIDELEDKQALFQSDTKEIKKEKERLEKAVLALKKSNETLNEFKVENEDGTNLLAKNIERIESGGDAWWSKIIGLATSVINYIGDISIAEITRSVESYLHLMILWAFKTMVLPILFVYMWLKMFQSIWKIKFDSFIKNQYEYVKSAIP